MRKLKCFQIPGMTVEEVLDEFNSRAAEFGITERDILTVSTSPPTLTGKLHTAKGPVTPNVEVTIIYWADK